MENVVVRRMQEHDMVKVQTLLKESFIRDAPLCRCQNVSDPLEISSLVKLWTSGNKIVDLSFVAEDVKLDEVVGCRLTALVRKDDEKEDDCKNIIRMRPVRKLLQNLYDNLDIFAKYNVEEYIQFKLLNVRKEYSGQGIATRLVNEATDHVLQQGYRLIVAEVTGIYSTRLYEKLNYDVLREIIYDTYTDENGEKIFTDTGVHKSAKLLAKLH